MRSSKANASKANLQLKKEEIENRHSVGQNPFEAPLQMKQNPFVDEATQSKQNPFVNSEKGDAIQMQEDEGPSSAAAEEAAPPDKKTFLDDVIKRSKGATMPPPPSVSSVLTSLVPSFRADLHVQKVTVANEWNAFLNLVLSQGVDGILSFVTPKKPYGVPGPFFIAQGDTRYAAKIKGMIEAMDFGNPVATLKSILLEAFISPMNIIINSTDIAAPPLESKFLQLDQEGKLDKIRQARW